MSVNVVGHRFAAANVNQIRVNHMRLDNYSFVGGLPQDVLGRVVEMASQSTFPIHHPEHTTTVEIALEVKSRRLY